MSRSFKKFAKACIAYGNNTPYYKLARRHLRQLNRNELRRLMSKYDIETVDENIVSYQNKHDVHYDSWNEPTDGTYIVDKYDRVHTWMTREEYEDWVNRLKRK